MANEKNDQRFPNGVVAGQDLPDKGNRTGLSDSYGVGSSDMNRGFTGGEKIGADTKSDIDDDND